MTRWCGANVSALLEVASSAVAGIRPVPLVLGDDVHVVHEGLVLQVDQQIAVVLVAGYALEEGDGLPGHEVEVGVVVGTALGAADADVLVQGGEGIHHEVHVAVVRAVDEPDVAGQGLVEAVVTVIQWGTGRPEGDLGVGCDSVKTGQGQD